MASKTSSTGPVVRGQDQEQADRVDAYIRRLIAEAPPLSETTAARLRVIFHGGGDVRG